MEERGRVGSQSPGAPVGHAFEPHILIRPSEWPVRRGTTKTNTAAARCADRADGRPNRAMASSYKEGALLVWPQTSTGAICMAR